MLCRGTLKDQSFPPFLENWLQTFIILGNINAHPAQKKLRWDVVRRPWKGGLTSIQNPACNPNV